MKEWWATLIWVQIGGSLAKLVYFSHDEPGDVELGGRLNFLKFETDKIDICIEFMRRLKQEYMEREGNRPSDLCVMATGGGAYKYYDKLREALGVEVQREDEMECLIIGTPLPPIQIGGILLMKKQKASTSSSPKSPAKYSPTARQTPCPSYPPAQTPTPTSSSTSVPA